jgi:hypothetical protein
VVRHILDRKCQLINPVLGGGVEVANVLTRSHVL